MKYSLCIDSIYPKNDLKEKLEKTKQTGFHYIKSQDWIYIFQIGVYSMCAHGYNFKFVKIDIII